MMTAAVVYNGASQEGDSMAEAVKKRSPSLKLPEIQKLMDMLEKSNLNELELELEGLKLRLCKSAPVSSNNSSGSPQIIMVPSGGGVPLQTAGQTAAPFTPAAPQAAGGSPDGEETAAQPKSDRLSDVKSPMVGTFYRAPAPGAEPFVKVGDLVKKGQTLCIIEAMKLMNEIESEVDGTVVDILTENAQPVEYGEKLFVVERAG